LFWNISVFLAPDKHATMATTKKTGAKKVKKRKIKFRKVELKVSSIQMKKIDLFCEAKRTTPNRVIKQAINEYLEAHAADIPEEEPVVKNQLKLFDPEVYNKESL
jgi:hypothetical protein